MAFGGQLLGTSIPAVPGAGDVSLDNVSFSYSPGVFSVGATATVKQLNAAAVLTLRSGRAPLLGLRLSDPGCNGDCIRMSSLLPDEPRSILTDLELPALNLTATSLTELAAADLTAQERDFFGDTYDSLPATLRFSPGLSLAGRLPLDALGEARSWLGYRAGSEAVLSGTLGANVTLSRLKGSRVSLEQLELNATLPTVTNSRLMPTWVVPSGPTTLQFRYANSSVAASFATAAQVSVGGSRFDTTIEGRLARSGQRTTIGFTGTINNWRQPFGVSWINTIERATVELNTSFGGGRPAEVDASVNASTMLGGKPFELEFGLSQRSGTSASLTASFGGSAGLGEIVGAFPGLRGPAAEIAANPALRDLSVGPASASLTLGGTAASSFELTATTRLRDVTSDLLVAVRPDGRFSVGIKASDISLSELVPDAARFDVDLPAAAMVLGSEEGRKPVGVLTDREFDFYKTLYGCADNATRGTCAGFTGVDLTRGLKFLAAFEMGTDVERMAAEIGIQTGGNVRLEGTIPLLGGSRFALRASLGNFRFDEQPDWFDHGDVSLEISNDGLYFIGSLGVRIEREGWTGPCDGLVHDEACYDVLDFSVTAGVSFDPMRLTLSGRLETARPWRHAFGQGWLEINRVALQLGVLPGRAGPGGHDGLPGRRQDR